MSKAHCAVDYYFYFIFLFFSNFALTHIKTKQTINKFKKLFLKYSTVVVVIVVDRYYIALEQTYCARM